MTEQASVEALPVFARWIAQIEAAARAADTKAFSGLFAADAWLRDLLCFSWDTRTVSGRSGIEQYVSATTGEDGKTRLARAGLHDLSTQSNSTLGAPKVLVTPMFGNRKIVEGVFVFALGAPRGVGRGYVRLVQEADGQWRAMTLMLNLEDLELYREAKGRPLGLLTKRATWAELRAADAAEVERDPTVLIVGGGQAGLMSAARLRRMGVRALVVDKSARVGDVWRNRYPNLNLHSTLHYSTLLYHTWPKTFPRYIPKDKLADALEAYAIAEELVIWLSSTVLPGPVYDPTSKRWTVQVERGGKIVSVRPKHILMAAGNFGPPRMPQFAGAERFKGPIYHSDNHRNTEAFRGKNVVVVGSCNTGADLCVDFVAKDARSVTMVQRSATCVMAASTAAMLLYDSTFNERFSIEDADFAQQSVPIGFILGLQAAGGTKHLMAIDRELHEGLTKAGFKLTWQMTEQGGETGILHWVLNQSGAGSMLDMGCGQLIIDGKVKVKNGEISHLEEKAVVMADGTKVPADAIVLATGYEPVVTSVVKLFGEGIVEKIGRELWGLDGEFEHKGCYRPTGQPGLWFAMGLFEHSRFFSKHLGMLILASEHGLLDD